MNRDNTQSQRAMFVITNKKTTRLTTHAKIATIVTVVKKGNRTMNRLNKILWGIISFGISVIHRTDATEYIGVNINWSDLGAGDIIHLQSVSGPNGLIGNFIYEVASSTTTTDAKTFEQWKANTSYASCFDIAEYEDLDDVVNFTTSPCSISGGPYTYGLKNCASHGSTIDIPLCNDTTGKTYVNLSNMSEPNDPDEYRCISCPGNGITSVHDATYNIYTLKYGSNVSCYLDTQGDGHRYRLYTLKISSTDCYNKQYYHCKAEENKQLLIIHIDRDALKDKQTIESCYIPGAQAGKDDSGNYDYISPNRCYYDE